MNVAFNKKTGEPINDFQSGASKEGLIKNAINSGIPEAEIEVRDVSPEQYVALEKQINEPFRLLAKQEEQGALVKAKELQKKYNLTLDEIKLLTLLIF